MTQKLTALAAAATAWACALTASAQQSYDVNDLPVPRAENDWMMSGLAPLVALVGLGLLVAAVAALIVVMIQRLPSKRREV